MTKDLVLAIDQGTTGSTALVMDTSGKTLARHTVEFAQHFPAPGRVEHDAEEIWQSVGKSIEGALRGAGVDASRIACIGITNQRETTLLWDKASGAPIHRAIVWQDRRTADVCERLRSEGHLDAVKSTTGLVLDPYFSGTKVAWILDDVSGARERARRGELSFGTIDTFLIHRLSGRSVHVTDVTNASRTLLFDIGKLAWSDDMLAIFDVPRSVLPAVVPSAGRIAETRGLGFLPDGIPISGVAGDQQAALFGQACFRPGEAKCTYGTGAFALTNIGTSPKASGHGLLTTVAWQIGDQTTYAVEGSAFIAGAAVQWLRDGLELFRSAAEIEALALTVPSSEGIYFVPALSGLGAPYWDPHARGLLTGITRGTTKAHVARAVLEGVAFQVGDLLAAMQSDFGAAVSRMRVDGGACANDLLMQFQADISEMTIERPRDLESTARGAAMLAGVGVGLFATPEDAARMTEVERVFESRMAPEERAQRRAGWALAVKKTLLHEG
jgi:glycerol kinase